MLCWTKSDGPAGFARVETQAVIDACNHTIEGIRTKRRHLRRGLIDGLLESKVFWWKYLWRWVSLGLIRKPRRKDAIREYRTGYLGPFPYRFQVDMHNGRQEIICERLLNLALSTQGHTMWISEEAADTCNIN